jgi:hypothetical protein
MTEARFDTLRTLGFASITASYQPLGLSITHLWREWKLTNATNGNMLISFDGTNDNMFVPANSFTLFDITTNSNQNAAAPLTMSIGTQFLIKYSSVPTSGAVYLEAIYEKGQ